MVPPPCNDLREQSIQASSHVNPYPSRKYRNRKFTAPISRRSCSGNVLPGKNGSDDFVRRLCAGFNAGCSKMIREGLYKYKSYY
jgi:hypothetical protein